MFYCISDIHGEYTRYKHLLSLIQFSDNDTLYILGDTIDRGPDGVDILLDIMHRPNTHMILGNHEAMCLATLGPDNEIGARELWQRNGGECTRTDLLHCRDKNTRNAIIDYLLSLPDHLDIVVNNKPFHLVHAWPANNQFDRLWTRPYYQPQPPIPDKTAIIGHTPTINLTRNPNEPMHIYHGPGFIDIDCGCGHNHPCSRLACFRLDDLAAFYI